MAKEQQHIDRILLKFILIIAYVKFVYTSCHSVESDQTRIIGGTQTLEEDWPFIAALFLVNQSRYFCGGTIISDGHILTAAHCMQGKGSLQKLSPNDIIVLLGAYNLTVNDEIGSIKKNVTEILIHPEWNVMQEDYDADVAILVLSEKISFTEYIKPVNLPADEVVIDGAVIHHVNGTIVGWGISENKTHEPIPRQAELQALNDSYCYRSRKNIVTLSSHRTFCAGLGDGAPNNGDSGGGLFVNNDSMWVQYGVISAIITDALGNVELKSIAVFSNVKAVKKWIVETIGTMMINLNCSYESFWNNYTCWLRDLDIRSDNLEVASFTGSHHTGNSSQDVNMIKIEKGTMFSLPNGIGKLFINLRLIVVKHCVRLQLIQRSNLENMDKLKELHIYENEVDILKEDTLWDLPSLEIFQLIRNKVKVLHEKTFDKNPKLRQVNLHSNQLQSLPPNLFAHNSALQKIDFGENSLQIIEINFTVLVHARTVILKNNVCIDTNHRSGSMKEFQSIIKINCTNDI